MNGGLCGCLFRAASGQWGADAQGRTMTRTSLPLCIPFEVALPWPPAGSKKNAFVACSKDAVRCCGKSNRRGSARLKKKKKIKDKKQIKPATWGLAAALNPEKRRDISIQPFISLGEVTGFLKGPSQWKQRLGGWELGARVGIPSLLGSPRRVCKAGAGTLKAKVRSSCWRLGRNQNNNWVY